MALPVVTIVGRPNVGKSSLLNLLASERVSIVDPRAGITRDRVSVIVEHEERYFELVDTGGVGIVDDHQLDDHVEAQIQVALRRADLILFVVDVRDGVVPLDVRVAEMLRKLNKPLLLIANKVDDDRLAPHAGEFEKLGCGSPLLLSAEHGYGRSDLLARLSDELRRFEDDTAPRQPVMKLAIVGKRNAGKSTLVNSLAGEDRVIVSEIPGTTRDAVDVQFEIDGQAFIAIDTAGVRKKRSMDEIDFYSYTRALRSIERSDVVLHLIDSTVPVGDVDLRLARAVADQFKPVVIGINKWDLAKGQASAEDYADYLSQVMPIAPYAPLTFLTAKTGRNTSATVDVARSLFNQASTRISTAKLNKVLEIILEARGPSPKRGTKQVKIYYGTQVAERPPTLVFFCNSPNNVTENYRRYLENRLREATIFKEIPLRLLFRPRQRD